MRRVLGGIDTISEWSGKIVSLLILVMVGVLLYEITLRYVFNAPTIWAHETSQHLFAAYSVLAGAYVLLHFEHVKVDILYSRLSLRARAILDSITYLMFFLFVIVMLVYGVQLASFAVKIKAASHTAWGPPIWPLRLMLPIGAFLILFQGLAHFIRALHAAILGKELV